MLAQVHSFVLQGIDPLPCEVEVDVAEVGMVKTTIVGPIRPICAGLISADGNPASSRHNTPFVHEAGRVKRCTVLNDG